jgi:hypothetical protein
MTHKPDDGEDPMNLRTTLKLTAASALFIGLATGISHAETKFKALEGIDAAPMNSAEMEAVQGKAFIGTQMNGQYLMWYDDQVPYPYGFDTTMPAVQNVFAYLQTGAIPADPSTVFYFLSMADQHGLTRFSPVGRNTAMGPCIPGWTVGC